MEIFSTPVYAAAAIFVILAISEALSIVSRAWIPSLLVTFVLYLAAVWAGIFPDDIAVLSTLGPAGATIIGVAIAHMGTMMPLEQLREQWKAIAIALGGVVGVIALILPIISAVFDYATAVAGAGPVAGGIVAFLITSERLTEVGREDVVVVAALCLGLQYLVGMPLANVILRKYAVRLWDTNFAELGDRAPAAIAAGSGAAAADAHDEPEAATTVWVPSVRREILTNRTVLLMLLFLLGAAAMGLDHLTGLNYGVWALILGIAARWLKIVPPSTLEKANSFGLAMGLIIIVVLASMNSVTPQAVAAAIVPTLLILAIGTTGILIGGFLISKLVGWDWMRGVPVALTALFGFPADYMICLEISRSVARNDAERSAIMSRIYSPMLIGGFATVTTSSVLVASILVSTL